MLWLFGPVQESVPIKLCDLICQIPTDLDLIVARTLYASKLFFICQLTRSALGIVWPINYCQCNTRSECVPLCVYVLANEWRQLSVIMRRDCIHLACFKSSLFSCVYVCISIFGVIVSLLTLVVCALVIYSNTEIKIKLTVNDVLLLVNRGAKGVRAISVARLEWHWVSRSSHRIGPNEWFQCALNAVTHTPSCAWVGLVNHSFFSLEAFTLILLNRDESLVFN